MSARRQIDRLRSDAIWVETFRRKIKRNPGPLDTPCWEWQGGLDKSGYGRLHIKRYHETGKGRNFIAHRLSYMIFTGAFIEPEEYILHQCHNRLCCNPDHFKLGDHQDNMDDLHDSGRVAGERNSNSKLSEDHVWDILALYYDKEWTVSNILEEYDVSRGTITDIVYGRTWGYLYDEFMELGDE
jgi:hypothetical protein